MVFAFIFGGVGVGEWLVLLAVVLIVVGPRRLPQTARKIGAQYAKLRRAAEGFKRQLMEMEESAEAQAKQVGDDVEKAFSSEGEGEVIPTEPPEPTSGT